MPSIKIFSYLKSIAYNRLKHLSYRWKKRKTKFNEIYAKNGFGGNESVSGPGSSLEQTHVIRNEIPKLIKELNAKTILDAPCGDLNWIKHVNLGVEKYIGIDIVPDMIAYNQKMYKNNYREFRVLDITKDKIPCVDIILCRDCFVHLSNKGIIRAIKGFKKSGSRYLLTTIFPSHQENVDMITGRGWRPINLTLPPFSFPPPLKLTREECSEQDGNYADKSLGLWELSAIKTSKYV